MIKVCKVTNNDLARTYLELLNGVLKLTDGELQLTAKIIDKYRDYGGQGLREPFLSKFVFSTDERRSLCMSLGKISNQNLSNRLNQLVGKGVLSIDDKVYTLNPTLLPQPEVTFKFVLKDDEPTETVQQGSTGEEHSSEPSGESV